MSAHVFAAGSMLIDRYEVESFHLAGGMQEVYLAMDRTLDRRVVVKTPKAGIKDRRFRRGAEMGARVNHPCVAATFDYFEDDKLTFLVEEFVPGVDLGRRLESDFYYLDPSLAAHVLHHISRALKEAHREGICHRDLKPSNVMTSQDPGLSIVKLTDFGIAKLAESELEAELELFEKDESTLTSSNTLLGALPYMAPECWTRWREAGMPMDIWALGCVGYHMLAGVPPFGTGRPAIANVLRAERDGVKLTPPNWFNQHESSRPLEAALWKIICDCIQVDPAARPQADQVALACDQLCYASASRRSGQISEFGIRYTSGGKSNTGNIADADGVNFWFFHGSDYFGSQPPAVGLPVNFCVYPGVPKPRSSPILLVRR